MSFISNLRNKNRKLKDRELVILSEQFYNMFLSGCDLITIMDTIIYSSSERVSNTCRIVRDNIEEGKTLSESFALSNSFPKLYINIIYAGETSGNIDLSFKLLSEYYSREESVKSKLLNASIYPAILFLVSFIAINIVFIFVIPNFQNSFLTDEIQIGFLTKFIFSLSHFIRTKGIFIFFIMILGIYYIVFSIKRDKNKKIKFQDIIYRLPLLKKINRIIISEKFSRILSNLIDSGINIGEAVVIATSIIDNPYTELKLEKSIEYIEEGNRISNSLDRANIFPRIFISMIESGEESGHFSDTLSSVSDFYKKELDHEIDRALKLFEPCLILVMGLVIGIVMLGLMYPIMNTISGIGG